ncbi:hypothetical protein LSTR_LSTR013981 [Laodelphax striatellus]|uniref:Uncharacterized protein n=1 Tax=Laodelphax striatellus TaxID=195883 RepID=A0A482XII5_LAOST|nr:hypothetical protein LSTR_LSTR013981 [Laodelphax striatellus]
MKMRIFNQLKRISTVLYKNLWNLDLVGPEIQVEEEKAKEFEDRIVLEEEEGVQEQEEGNDEAEVIRRLVKVEEVLLSRDDDGFLEALMNNKCDDLTHGFRFLLDDDENVEKHQWERMRIFNQLKKDFNSAATENLWNLDLVGPEIQVEEEKWPRNSRTRYRSEEEEGGGRVNQEEGNRRGRGRRCRSRKGDTQGTQTHIPCGVEEILTIEFPMFDPVEDDMHC